MLNIEESSKIVQSVTYVRNNNSKSERLQKVKN